MLLDRLERCDHTSHGSGVRALVINSRLGQLLEQLLETALVIRRHRRFDLFNDGVVEDLLLLGPELCVLRRQRPRSARSRSQVLSVLRVQDGRHGRLQLRRRLTLDRGSVLLHLLDDRELLDLILELLRCEDVSELLAWCLGTRWLSLGHRVEPEHPLQSTDRDG